MAYYENVAPGRENPSSDRVAPAPAPRSASNQEKTQGQSSKFSTPSAAPKNGVQLSNQLKTKTSDKGTGVAGRPSSIGNAGRTIVLAAVENTDPKGKRSL